VQLESDQERWGDEWRHRPIAGQVSRMARTFQTYMGDWLFSDTDFPWIKLIGGAYIAWVRLQHPEYLLEPIRDPDYNGRPESKSCKGRKHSMTAIDWLAVVVLVMAILSTVALVAIATVLR